MKKRESSIGKKVIVMILCIGVILCTASLCVIWKGYTNYTMDMFEKNGEDAGELLASRVTAEELERYYTTGEKDDRYFEILQLTRDIVHSYDLEYLYVARVDQSGGTFLFDSDEVINLSSGNDGGLGVNMEVDDYMKDNLQLFLEGKEIPPYVDNNSSFGWLITTMVPICKDTGEPVAYAMTDIDMNDVMKYRTGFMLTAFVILIALTAVMMVVCLSVANKQIVRPIRLLTRAVREYQKTEDPAILNRLEIRSRDEVGTLTESFCQMVMEVYESNVAKKDVALREQKMENELDLSKAISGALLPQSLPERKGGYPFQVCGSLQAGQSLFGGFYDYFMADRNHLCVLVGDAPGDGVSLVLYTAMARAILKSQLRSGLPLMDSVSEANRQIHELSSDRALHTLVGVLDSTTGQFTYVNAGGQSPFLLRQDRYQQVRALSYDPLGQSENVMYRTQELELRQGERLLLYTNGLTNAFAGQTGRSFSSQMTSRLNEKETRLGNLEKTLTDIRALGGAPDGGAELTDGYALLILEYSQRDKVQAHVVLHSGSAGEAALRRFLREQLAANDLSPRWTAETVVLGEELLSLCVRQAGDGSRFVAECEVSQEEGIVRLRIRGDLQGRNPLEEAMDSSAQNGLAFIQKNAQQVLFKPGNGLDTVELVRAISGEKAGSTPVSQ